MLIASGTDALLLVVRGYDLTGSVLTSPLHIFRNGRYQHNARATPKFADIEHETFNIDHTKIQETISKETDIDAIIPFTSFR
jgi:dTDP-4-amino-4,6-dideoxygalactose transaminase